MQTPSQGETLTDEAKLKGAITMIIANNVISAMIPRFDDIEDGKRSIPKGAYIYKDSEYYELYARMERAAHDIALVGEVLGANDEAIYRACRAARRWYAATNWQMCLPDADADRLLNYMIEQYPTTYRR